MNISPEWAARIAEAQLLPTVEIGGHEYQRLRHVGHSRCRDCAVLPGQVHVEPCCVERCPRCHVGQYITCSCFDAAERSVQ